MPKTHARRRCRCTPYCGKVLSARQRRKHRKKVENLGGTVYALSTSTSSETRHSTPDHNPQQETSSSSRAEPVAVAAPSEPPSPHGYVLY